MGQGNSDAITDPLLEQHRRDIEALDRRILHLTCERLELARQIGELKSTRGIPLRNFRVEAQVRQRFAEACSFLGLDPQLGHDLALFLIHKAVEEQATLMDTAYVGDQLRALVVGGKGGMGRWIARFLHGQGHRVLIMDPADSTSPFPEVQRLDHGVGDADLIVLAVPMSECAAVLEQVGALQPRGVVAEMCSLKGHLLPVITRLQQEGTRVISFHPLFGPGVKMLSGRRIVFCTDADPDDVAVVRALFEETSAGLVSLSIAEHDRRMAVILGLTHLSNLVYGSALMHSGLTVDELTEVAGVTFDRQLQTAREITQENANLYFQIQTLNPATAHIAGLLQQGVQDFLSRVSADDDDGFTQLMNECRDYLGGD